MNLHGRVENQHFIDRLERIQKKSRDLSEPLNECAEVLVSSVMENFNSEGRFSEPGSWRGGSNKWAKSGAARKRGGMTLNDSGQLRDSIQKAVSGNSAEVGTNKEYAAVHNFGFDDHVTVKEHKRKTKSGKVTTVRSHTRRMHVTARPFMVMQDDDAEEMIDILDKHVLK